MQRFKGVDAAEMDADQRKVAEAMVSGPRGHATGLMGLWLNHPHLAERMQHVGEYLRFKGTLPANIREMVILMVAREWLCFHEWLVHAPLAEKAGLPPAVIEAIRHRRVPTFDDGAAQAVHAYVREMLETRRVSDAAFNAVTEHFGVPGVVELAGLIGHYIIGAATLNAADYALPAGVAAPFPVSTTHA